MNYQDQVLVGSKLENNKDNIGFSMGKKNNRGFKF